MRPARRLRFSGAEQLWRHFRLLGRLAAAQGKARSPTADVASVREMRRMRLEGTCREKWLAGWDEEARLRGIDP